mmetsp:Transcript_79005/g.115711  ORF Transcript_79005/g.115711 Transcript_79005/m.115711 type:complete len:978 (-) Transcript_79005:116-3049(-)
MAPWNDSRAMPSVLKAALVAVQVYAFYFAASSAYTIRLHAVNEYGRIIHEFDPWFNFRATKYLHENGWTKFFRWYDHESWYPLGRPVGTTIYPGMQITSVCICNVLEYLGTPMSLNDVCVFVPAWFGVIATTFLALLASECSGSASAGVGAALIMSIIPAHIMRSVAGGYDNESVAITALCMTFYFWCRSLRNDGSWWIGIFTGLAYTYMVMVWGGYIFVLNMIGVHAGLLWITGCHSTKLHRAYSLFYLIGTYGAVHVPVVGWAPLKSLEQLGAFGVFIALQLMEFCEVARRKKNLTNGDVNKLRLVVFGATAAVFGVITVILLPTGYFGPLSARVRGLFVRHTRTGNPLVDSVAEHQPASPQAYWQYLHYMCYCAPVGYALCMCRVTPIANLMQYFGAGPWWSDRGDAKMFLITYATIGYFFSNKMVRLVLLMGPIASALGGIALGAVAEWCVWQAAMFIPDFGGDEDEEEEVEEEKEEITEGKGKGRGKGRQMKETASTKEEEEPKKGKKRGPVRGMLTQGQKDQLCASIGSLVTALEGFYNLLPMKLARLALVVYLGYTSRHYAGEFTTYCEQLAHGMSNPSLVFKAHLNNGQMVVVNDYMEAYHWLRDKTPKDARIMAWWDYGYQITGIGERTTLADGNTWNHEHIATIGKMFASPEDQAHELIRHVADFVLVWTGGGGDDLAKSPHMARIGNSVYPGLCPNDPTCRMFGFTDRQGTPTPMMGKSLLYKLVTAGQRQGVSLNSTLWREVYTSRYNKVRIFKVLKVSKKSRKWLADPANRICDAPGSWYCSGQYPPAWKKLISQRVSFAQLEDFNRGGGNSEYTKQYMARMNGEAPATNEEADATIQFLAAFAPRSKAEAQWEDTDLTSQMWAIVKNNDLASMKSLIDAAPNVVHARSSDGRGPLWWAYEFKREGMKNLLVKRGIDVQAKDTNGIRALDLDSGKKRIGGSPKIEKTADSGEKKKKKKSKKKKA